MSKPKKGPIRRFIGSATRKLLIAGGLLGLGAAGAGAMATARERMRQPLAPPDQLPPGY